MFEGFERKTVFVENSWFLRRIEKDLGYYGECACIRGVYGAELIPLPVQFILYSSVFLTGLRLFIVFLIKIRYRLILLHGNK